MAEQREPNDYFVKLRGGGHWWPATMRLYDGVEKWFIAGGAKQVYDIDDLSEIGPRILPPSAAPSQPQPGWQTIESAPKDTAQGDFLISLWNSQGDCCWVNIVRNPNGHMGLKIATHWMPLGAPSNPSDLVAASVLDAEPGHPSNPAVETIVVSAEEYERVLATLNDPAGPTEAAIRGAEILRSLRTPKPASAPSQVSPDAEAMARECIAEWGMSNEELAIEHWQHIDALEDRIAAALTAHAAREVERERARCLGHIKTAGRLPNTLRHRIATGKPVLASPSSPDTTAAQGKEGK